MPRIDIHIGDKVFEDWGTQTLKISEGVAIERAYGKTYDQFREDLRNGSMYAIQVLVWSVLRRENPELRVGDVDDISFGDISVVTVDDEPPPVEGESDDPFANASGEAQKSPSNSDESAT